jgi:putative hydrolase of the HAD superfamily
MIKYIIFDLSEVLISGVLGVEKVLAEKIPQSMEAISKSLYGNWFNEYMIGGISEDIYLTEIVKRQNWNIEIDDLKKYIRDNFHNEVEGMPGLLEKLSSKYKLILHSDHSKEWIDYIKSVHPFLNLFEHMLFSYELGMTKHFPSTFSKALERLNITAEECLLIDDHQRNIDAAAKVGIKGIRFENYNQLLNDLEVLGIL